VWYLNDLLGELFEHFTITSSMQRHRELRRSIKFLQEMC
jgi:hypothetical protein